MSFTPPEPHACAVCGRVLDYVHDRGWIHSIAAPAEDDHIAVPVAFDQVQVRGRCDFCFADNPVWVVPAKEIRYEIPALDSGGGMDSDWAACDPCGQLIMKDRWNALLDRVQGSWERRNFESMTETMQAELRKLYRLLRKSITGSLRPI